MAAHYLRATRSDREALAQLEGDHLKPEVRADRAAEIQDRLEKQHGKVLAAAAEHVAEARADPAG